MKKCLSCKEFIPDEDRRCSLCGENVTVYEARCHVPNRPSNMEALPEFNPSIGCQYPAIMFFVIAFTLGYTREVSIWIWVIIMLPIMLALVIPWQEN